jgi:L-glyceraldehyde 3-phosphate reductase
MAQFAIAWLLIDPRVTSVLVGASKVSQIEDNVATLKNLAFSEDEKTEIRRIIA